MVKLVGVSDPPVCFSLLQTDGRTGSGQPEEEGRATFIDFEV